MALILLKIHYIVIFDILSSICQKEHISQRKDSARENTGFLSEWPQRPDETLSEDGESRGAKASQPSFPFEIILAWVGRSKIRL